MPRLSNRLPARLSLPGLIVLVLAACENGAPGPTGQTANIVPVVTSVVARQQITDRVESVGTARASESVEITARVSNVVTDIHFNEGGRVDKGEVLVELEASEARANLAAAEAALVEIRTQYNRSQELIRDNVISQSVLDQQAAQVNAAEARVAAARAVLADHTLRAPFAGRVGLRRVSIGSLVTPGTLITTLDKVSEMQLDFSVPEAYIDMLAPGQVIEARSVAYPDEVFSGVVDSVDTRVDPVTRTVTVRARLDNEQGRLRPGMFMTVVLRKNPRDAIMVPELALVPEGDDKFVFVVRDDTAIQREVQIGTRLPGRVEIIGGLETGEEIIVEGTQSIRHGSEVRRVNGVEGGNTPAAVAEGGAH